MHKEYEEDNNHKEEMTNSQNEYKLANQTLKLVKRGKKGDLFFLVSQKQKEKQCHQ